jgi:hypothetical protein
VFGNLFVENQEARMTLPFPLKNRIVKHVKVKASDLKPNPLNPRVHSETQRSILHALLQEIGFSRSVLAYVADADRLLPDQEGTPLTLIDGHLRREELGDGLVDVEVLDVNDEEAQALLLSLDPLVLLAEHDTARLDELRRVVERDSAAVASLWAALDASASRVQEALGEADEKSPGLKKEPLLEEKFYLLIECRDEEEQVRLLSRFQAEGLKCSAKIA